MHRYERLDSPLARKTTATGICFTLIWATAICAPALAAQPATPSAAATDTLEEVVITARKSSESLQEVPLSVTAITAEQIEERLIKSVDDVARYTPGLVFDKAFGRSTERPVIRGMSSILAGTNGTVESGAAYFVDGVYYPGDIQSLDMSGVERVEVVRGPQSALFGRNSYSGAINFITRSPSDTFNASLRSSWDSDEHDVTVRAEGPLLPKLKGSITFTSNNFLGQWINQVTQKPIGQERTTAFSGTLEFKPTDDFSARVRVAYNRDRDGTRPFWFQSPLANNCYPGTRSLASYVLGPNNPYQYFCGNLKAGPIYANDAPAANGVAVIDPSVPTNLLNLTPASTLYNTGPGVAFSGINRNLRVYLGRFDWDIAGSGYTLSLDGGARSENRKSGSDSDFSSFNSLSPANFAAGFEAGGANSSVDDYKSSSVELRLSSPTTGKVHWLVGGNYFQQTLNNYDLNFLYPDGRALPDQTNKTQNTAYFAMVEWKFLPTWSVSVEGRQATDNKKQWDYCVSTSSCTIIPAGQTSVALATVSSPGGLQFFGDQDFSKFTPRATVKWQPNSNVNLYASYSQGVKPGGFNGGSGLTVTPAKPSFQQETSKVYELGAKATWLDGQVQTNLAVYRTVANQIQLTTAIPNNAGAVSSLTTNQGNGQVDGFEFEGRWKASRYLTFGMSYALANSKFTYGCDDFQWILTSGGGTYIPSATLPIVGGCPSSPNNPNGAGNASIVGKQFPFSAKNNASMTADFRAPLQGGNMKFYANLGGSYVDRRPVQVHNLAWVPSATIFDLRFGVDAGAWQLGVYGRNVGNNDSPLVATRWFSSVYVGSTAVIPGLALLKSPPAVPTSQASYSLPRGFFGDSRRQRQVGVEFSYAVGGR